MRAYSLRFLAVAAAALALQIATCWLVPGLIPAEYWVREEILLKRHFLERIPSPRIIVLGGSNCLFGVDAVQLERETGIPSFNFGLHVGLRLSRILQEGSLAARPGDILVLPLEIELYNSTAWGEWQVQNALAWDRAELDAASPWTKAVLFSPFRYGSLAPEILAASWGSMLHPSDYAERRAAMAPASELVERYESGRRQDSNPYSPFNLDGHGDVPLIAQSPYRGGGRPAELPDHISPDAREVLARFVAEMRARDVRVFFSHPPYLVEGTPAPGWEQAEQRFRAQIEMLGSVVLENRDRLFFPRDLFFDTYYHLNAAGRRLRTQRLADALKDNGIVPAPAPDQDAKGGESRPTAKK